MAVRTKVAKAVMISQTLSTRPNVDRRTLFTRAQMGKGESGQGMAIEGKGRKVYGASDDADKFGDIFVYFLHESSFN